MNLNKLRGKLVEHGKTYRGCAEAIGISTASFNSKMNGKSRFYVDELEELADYLGMDREEKIETFIL